MPNIPDDEVSPLKPDLKWLGRMLSILVGLWLFCYIFFYSFSHLIISHLDLADEKKYFGNAFLDDTATKLDTSFLSYKLKIPKNIDLYLIQSDEVNAYATLWWNILFTSRLLENIQYQEEFLFILWHEIEHIKNRDVIQWFSTKIPFYITLTYLWIDIWLQSSDVFDVTSSYMSRQNEIKADKGGIEFVKENQWNTDCILHFFQNKDDIFSKYLFFSASHPSNTDRIKQIQQYSLWCNDDFSKCKSMLKKEVSAHK